MGVAITGVTFRWSPPPGSPCQGTNSGGGQPVGSPLAIGTAFEETRGVEHWYNFSVEFAGSDISWRDVSLQVDGPTNTTPTLQWNLTVIASGLGIRAVYSLPDRAWISGGSEEITSNQAIALFTGVTNLSAQGDILRITLEGACFGGTTSAAIP